MSIDDELTAIETAVNECEKEIKAGTISAEVIARQIRSITDPNAMIAKGGELTGALIKRNETMKIMRLKELMYQHPNDLRIRQLGRRAAECFITINEIGLTVSEMLVSPDLKPGVRAQNQQALNGLKMVFADLLQ